MVIYDDKKCTVLCQIFTVMKRPHLLGMIYARLCTLFIKNFSQHIIHTCDTDWAQAEPNFALSKGTTLLCTYMNMNNHHKHI